MIDQTRFFSWQPSSTWGWEINNFFCKM